MVAPSAVVSDLAPTGTLRAAINFDNPVLARKDARGEPAGLSVDLSRELARRLGVAVDFVPFYSAGKVVEGIASWDVCFLAIDPKRATLIDFTEAYVVIEGVYMVDENSSIRSNEEVDRTGIRVAVCAGSAYDLFLSRELKQADLVRAPTAKEVTPLFLERGLEVVAGVRPQLESDARRFPGLRLLPGSFMKINQAMGTPRGREAVARYLREFIEEMKTSGFVAEAFVRHRIEGASVAPAATL